MRNADALTRDETLAVLQEGGITLQGVVPWSSNYTFLITLTLRDAEVSAIYKPQEGERPLWDFDTGTLCQREVAAYVLADALGWPNIAPTVLRDGPYGLGSVQLYVEHDRRAHYFTLRERPEHTAALQRIAAFDLAANNADRKGGHVLAGHDGKIWAIDHGLTFHHVYKLRTVIWDWAGEPIPPDCLVDLQRVYTMLNACVGPVYEALEGLLSAHEREALLERLSELLESRVLPSPRRHLRNVPYPLI